MKELDEDRELARQLKQPSAAIAATVAQAKLAGDRKEVCQPGEFENMKAEELAEVLARNAAALGLKVSVKATIAQRTGSLTRVWYTRPVTSRNTASRCRRASFRAVEAAAHLGQQGQLYRLRSERASHHARLNDRTIPLKR
jgi:hypothetical protein